MTRKKNRKKINIAAVILAAGNGQRIGGLYKQFIRIDGRPILYYSIDIFLKCPSVGRIILVVPEKKKEYVRRLISQKYKDKRIEIIPGGATRRFSSYNALKYLKEEKEDCDFVVFHDGARPLVSKEMVDAVIKGAGKYGASVLGAKVLNVIIKAKDGLVREAHNPGDVYNTQTPHCYAFGTILKAHESDKNKGKGKDTLENIELVYGIGGKINIIDSFYRNMKLTYKQDIIPISALLKKKNEDRFYKD